jgi:hypothetical protein
VFVTRHFVTIVPAAMPTNCLAKRIESSLHTRSDDVAEVDWAERAWSTPWWEQRTKIATNESERRRRLVLIGGLSGREVTERTVSRNREATVGPRPS